MLNDVIKRSISGIAVGGILTFIALTILIIFDIESSVKEIWMHMLASFLMGIYFGLSSFIYENETWSPLKKTIIHFTLSIGFYFIVALSVGWVPMNMKAIIFSFFLFILIYAIFWTGYYIYFKKIEATLNKDLEGRN
ncbi:DUF3021 family protein [Ornithinibacillus sp. L9]|uniref:DUF3021 family protein n=1 Tax=Ornithinibacillus caprae TaxID=2678566 RepID=A0A6N8FNR7_9BACI|nr:DUF3021 domain-containing protein [Ornithinibacillus caprae]MUK89439.1 DUF3021 family protein [Ornithinibacillus caprae]